MFIVIAGCVAAYLTTGPISDIDSFWHVRLGREILDRHSIGGAGSDWNLSQHSHSWTTSQWLSEVVMSVTVAHGGWGSLVALRITLSLILLVLIARLVVPGRSPWVAAYVFAAVTIPMFPMLQERPQLASLLFTAGLAGMGRDVLRGHKSPGLVWVVAVVLWANLHGMWVLAPMVAALLSVCLLCEHRLLEARRTLTIGALATAAGCLTPLGIKGLLLPASFRAATTHIAEWQPTILWDWYSLGLGMLLLAVIAAWARSEHPIAPGEIVWVTAWAMFAILAARNVPVSVLMLAPVVADRLDLAVGGRRSSTSPRERDGLLVAAATIAMVGVVSSVVAWLHVSPLSAIARSPLAAALN